MTVSGRLVGREPALAMAGSALAGALAGAGRLLLVGGEPGIGKTALARAVAEDGRRAGAGVVWSACPPGGAPAYWPWTQVLRELAETTPVPPAAVRLLSTVGLSTTGDAHERFELHDAVARTVAVAAREHPLVVVIDDLHWADDGSLDLLDSLARGLAARQVLVLGTYRELEAPRSLTAIASSCDGLTLGGLDEAAVVSLVTTITGQVPTAEDAEALRQRTGGNPLFVREVARLLVAHGPASALAGPLPVTVAETLGRRLAPLSEACRALLAVVAVADDRDPGLLAVVTGQDEAAVAALLEEAAMARVLLDAPAGDGGRPFAHELFREAVLAAVDADRRRHLEWAVGHALANAAAGGAVVGAGRVASHLGAGCSGTVEDLAVAQSWSVRAAEEATAALGHEEAVRWYRLSRDLASEADPHLTLALGEAELRAGDPAARGTFVAAAAEARAAGDADALAAAALGLHRVGARGDHDELLALLDEAIRAAAPGSASRPRLLAAVARDRRHSRHPAAECRAPAEEAVAAARALGDPRLVAECLLALHDALWEPGSSAVLLPVVEQMADAAAQAADPELVAVATVLRAACRITLNDPLGLVDLAAYGDLADALGHARGRWESLSRRATLGLITGAVEDSGRLAEEARELGMRMQIPDAAGVHGTLTWPLSLFDGRRQAIARDIQGVDVVPVRNAFLASAARAAGEHEEARRHALTLDPTALDNLTDLEFVALVADALVSAGPTDAARTSYRTLLPHAGTNVLVGGCASYWGPVDLYLGQLAGSLGDPAAARRHLEAAEHMARVLGAPRWAEHVAAVAAELDDRDASPRLVLDGSVWTVRWRGTEGHVPDAKGLRDLATLVARPGHELTASELMTGAPAAGADPVLDDRAKQAYRRRLEELDGEIDDATVAGDLGRAEHAQDEREALIHALSAAVGLGGRDRRLGDDAERARKAVTARIRDAIRRIGAVHPELGAHLEVSVRTGTWCSYRPDAPP